MKSLTTESAKAEFLERGAKLCVVIPSPKETPILHILKTGKGEGIIVDPDRDGDDLFVVRIGDGPQESLSHDELSGRLRSDYGEE